MLLRRFYVQQNEKGEFYFMDSREEKALTSHTAPNPRPKKDRKLRTDFDDPSSS